MDERRIKKPIVVLLIISFMVGMAVLANVLKKTNCHIWQRRLLRMLLPEPAMPTSISSLFPASTATPSVAAVIRPRENAPQLRSFQTEPVPGSAWKVQSVSDMRDVILRAVILIPRTG